MGDLAVRRVPDFRAGGFVMGPRIVRIGELIEHHALAVAVHFGSEIACAFHALGLGHRNDLGAVGPHRGAALLAHVLGHDQHHAIALHGRDHGQRDTGVARGGFDERIARLDLAALGGAPDHAVGGSILDRTGRIVALELGQQRIRGMHRIAVRQTLQARERAVADEMVEGGIRVVLAVHWRSLAVRAWQVNAV